MSPSYACFICGIDIQRGEYDGLWLQQFRIRKLLCLAASPIDWPRSGPVPKFQDWTEFLWFGPVWSGKKLDQTGLHQKDVRG
jgi:hypothetical protein